MSKGFVLGKFMPLHKGHLAMIHFASQLCDELSVLVCYTEKESIPGAIRMQWLSEELKAIKAIRLIPFEYNDTLLPNTSVASREISAIWAKELKKLVPDADLFISSEPYGEYVAGYMNIRYEYFDVARDQFPISASAIRERPFEYWDYIADSAKPWFVKKVAILGTESTGKSTLTEVLARHYQTSFVPEMARDIVEHTDECTYSDLGRIAESHARAIKQEMESANRLLFVDTDINITRSYASFLFSKDLITEPWIEEANSFDLYLFLEPDCPYIQDGTRLSEEERNRLSIHHKTTLNQRNISYYSISGYSWEQRTQSAINIIDEKLLRQPMRTTILE